MIALDTNILVRYLLNDSVSQADIAEDLLFGATPCSAPITVILELVWVLETKKYSRPHIASAIRLLNGLSNFAFEYPDASARALLWYENGIDFADALHLALSWRATELLSFDKAFVKAAARLRTVPAVVSASS